MFGVIGVVFSAVGTRSQVKVLQERDNKQVATLLQVPSAGVPTCMHSMHLHCAHARRPRC
jgi:hypothetical protein